MNNMCYLVKRTDPKTHMLTSRFDIFHSSHLTNGRKRDKKKLYSSFYEGKTKNIVGLDIKAEFPKKPDIILKNYGNKTVQDCVNDLIVFHENLEKLKN